MKKENEKLPNVPTLRFPEFTDLWRQGLIKDFGYFYYGKSAPKWSLSKTATIPCIRYGELYTSDTAQIDKIKSYTEIPASELKFSKGNEVLVPRVGEDPLDFYKCSYLSIPNVAIGEMISVYNTNENPLFIAYYFRAKMRYEFAKRVEGGNVSNLYFNYLEDIKVHLPSQLEQVKIAKFISLLDQRIDTQSKIISKYETLIKGLCDKIFKHDKTTQLSDLVKCKSSTLQENRITTNNNGQYKVFGASGMISTINNYQFDNSAVLVLKDGSKAGKIQYASGKYSVVGTSVVLIPNDARDARYLYFAMLSVDFEKYKVGSGIPHIYFKDYSVEKIYYPDFKQREKIVKTLDTYEAKTNIEKEMLSALQKQKAFLLKSMFI